MDNRDEMRKRAREADKRAERRQDEQRVAGEKERAERAQAARDAVRAGIDKSR
jgi:hypothetical protein